MLNLPAERPHAPALPHRTSVTENGSFAIANCTCGWRGPARRARDRARRDATRHSPD